MPRDYCPGLVCYISFAVHLLIFLTLLTLILLNPRTSHSPQSNCNVTISEQSTGAVLWTTDTSSQGPCTLTLQVIHT